MYTDPVHWYRERIPLWPPLFQAAVPCLPSLHYMQLLSALCLISLQHHLSLWSFCKSHRLPLYWSSVRIVYCLLIQLQRSATWYPRLSHHNLWPCCSDLRQGHTHPDWAMPQKSQHNGPRFPAGSLHPYSTAQYLSFHCMSQQRSRRPHGWSTQSYGLHQHHTCCFRRPTDSMWSCSDQRFPWPSFQYWWVPWFRHWFQYHRNQGLI